MCKNKDIINKIEYLSNCMLAYYGIGVWACVSTTLVCAEINCITKNVSWVQGELLVASRWKLETILEHLESVMLNDNEIKGGVYCRIQFRWIKWRSASGVVCDRKVTLKFNENVTHSYKTFNVVGIEWLEVKKLLIKL